MAENERVPLDPNKVQSDHIMAFVYWAKVNNKHRGGDGLSVRDLDTKLDFDVRGRELITKSYSADVFEKTEKVTKTAIAEKLVQAYNRPFTVVFKKSDGSLRTLRGRLVQPEPLLGRSLCEDLDIAGEERLRLVDHREIQVFICDGIKYELK